LEKKKDLKPKDSVAKKMDFGARATTYKDIGIDLCKQKGGWGWRGSILDCFLKYCMLICW